MLTIEEIRRQNARTLMEQAGNQSRFAMRLGMARQQASHIVGSKGQGSGSTKNIGSDLARKIEAAFALESGWMDHIHNAVSASRQDDLTIDIPMLTPPGRATPTPEPGDACEVFEVARTSKQWLRMNVSPSSLDNLALMTARGDSMSPSIEDGSILLVDRGVKSVRIDSVYVLQRDDVVLVKRVRSNFPKGITIVSDNEAFEPLSFDSLEDAGVRVLGRVLLAWNAKKF